MKNPLNPNAASRLLPSRVRLRADPPVRQPTSPQTQADDAPECVKYRGVVAPRIEVVGMSSNVASRSKYGGYEFNFPVRDRSGKRTREWVNVSVMYIRGQWFGSIGLIGLDDRQVYIHNNCKMNGYPSFDRLMLHLTKSWRNLHFRLKRSVRAIK